jgi:hypothetical protein
VQVDLARLKEEKERLETENQDMRSRLDKLRNYKELDIQIDMLGDSPQGNEILRKKYATLLNKISFERSVYNELTEHYFQIQDKLGYKEKVSKSLKELKQARETQAFHLQRHEDQMPQLLGLRETVRSQESIISNLEYSIKEELSRKDKSKMTQVDVNYQRLKNERNLLKEKDLQLQMLLGMNDGRLTREMVARLKTEKFFQTDTAELRKLKATANDCLSQIEHYTTQLDERNIQTFVQETYEKNSGDNPTKIIAREGLRRKCDEVEQRGDILESELIELTKKNYKRISDLKYALMTKNNLLLTKIK